MYSITEGVSIKKIPFVTTRNNFKHIDFIANYIEEIDLDLFD